jgi:anti-sigma B factor antagonist
MARQGRVEISHENEGEDLTVWIEGELDLSTIPVVTQYLDAQIGGNHHAVLAVDLTGVTFMDSSGLRMLIELNERAQREGWNLSLRSPKHEAATLVLRMTGADDALPFVGDRGP